MKSRHWTTRAELQKAPSRHALKALQVMLGAVEANQSVPIR